MTKDFRLFQISQTNSYMLKIYLLILFRYAIRIDNELNKGSTYKSATFDNDLLSGVPNENKFICLKFELYALT